MAPVTGEHVLSGGFARQISKQPTVRPVDQREEYAAREGGAIYTLLTWDPKARLNGTVVMRLYDDENRPLLESKPKKTDLTPGDFVFTQWQVPLPSRPGVYRIDVTLDAAICWRGFFRVTE